MTDSESAPNLARTTLIKSILLIFDRKCKLSWTIHQRKLKNLIIFGLFLLTVDYGTEVNKESKSAGTKFVNHLRAKILR